MRRSNRSPMVLGIVGSGLLLVAMLQEVAGPDSETKDTAATAMITDGIAGSPPK